jgi:hypothetical protein
MSHLPQQIWCALTQGPLIEEGYDDPPPGLIMIDLASP